MTVKHVDRNIDAGTSAVQAPEFPSPNPLPTRVELYGLFQELGTDPKINIDTIVKKTSKLLGGSFTYYCRYNGSTGKLCAWEGNFDPGNDGSTMPLNGSLSYDAFKDDKTPVAIKDLHQTTFALSDPAVKSLGSASFIGCPVSIRSGAIGSLVVLNQKKRQYSSEEVQIISILAKALSLEEARMEKCPPSPNAPSSRKPC